MGKVSSAPPGPFLNSKGPAHSRTPDHLTTTEEDETVSKNTTACATLPDFWVATGALPRQRVQLDEPRHSPTTYLGAVERATIRAEVVHPENTVAANSILHEGAFRLLLFQEREVLQYMSGHYIADHLNYVFWAAHPAKLARRGWILLAALDAADLVQVTLSAEPLPDDPAQRFRRMRLSERLVEINAMNHRDFGIG